MLQHKPLSEIGGDEYGNPAHRPIGNLFVLNDDEIAAGTGFPMHGHAGIEIISYVRDGVVTHEDRLGNKGHTRAGDMQVMSAGTGIRHADYNEQEAPARLFQIWLRPREPGGRPQWSTRVSKGGPVRPVRVAGKWLRCRRGASLAHRCRSVWCVAGGGHGRDVRFSTWLQRLPRSGLRRRARRRNLY